METRDPQWDILRQNRLLLARGSDPGVFCSAGSLKLDTEAFGLKAEQFWLQRRLQHVGEGTYDHVLATGAKLARELYIVGIRERNRHGPAIRAIYIVNPLAVMAAGKIELNLQEAEFLVSLPDGCPALIGALSGCELILQAAQRDLMCQQPAKGAIDEHPSRHSEFDVSEMLNADPGSRAEKYDDEPGHVLPRHT